MYRDNTVGVVVPAYNEEGFVGEVIDTMPAFVDRVYAVDDRSTDQTWAEIRAHAAAANDEWDGRVGFERRIIPIRHEENSGVGAAIKTGYRRAVEEGIDVVAVMNGDGQMDPDILDRIVDPVAAGDADYSKGNRLLYSDYRNGMTTWRLAGNTVLSFLTKVASGYWQLTDPQNGYTAVSTRALEDIDVDALYDDYGFCNHLLVRLNAVEARVADVAMPAVYGDERSSIRYRRFIPSLSWLMLRSFAWRLKTRYLVFAFHPLVLFYALGISGVGAGCLVAVGALAVGASTTTALFTLAVALLTVLVGALGVAGGMVLDVRANAGLESHHYDRLDAAASSGEEATSDADSAARPPPGDADSEADGDVVADGDGGDRPSVRTRTGPLSRLHRCFTSREE